MIPFIPLILDICSQNFYYQPTSKISMTTLAQILILSHRKTDSGNFEIQVTAKSDI